MYPPKDAPAVVNNGTQHPPRPEVDSVDAGGPNDDVIPIDNSLPARDDDVINKSSSWRLFDRQMSLHVDAFRQVAHSLHYVSIAILGFLLFEVYIKLHYITL